MKNVDAIDRWTPVHFATGFAVGALPLPVSVALLVGYEVIEHYAERGGNKLFRSSQPERPANVAADLAAGFAGVAVMQVILASQRRRRR